MADSAFYDMFPLGPDQTSYRKLEGDFVTTAEFEGEEIVKIDPEALRALSEEAFRDINHLLRPSHLQQLANILEDSDASPNDRFVAFDLLKNANIAAGGVLPMCQDTGTAIIMGKKGRRVWTDGTDAAALGQGVLDAYDKNNLRYSQVSALSMFEEKNTKNNLPAQIDLYAQGKDQQEDAYKFLFVAKGGGSANKTFLHQATPSLVDRERMLAFLDEKIRTLGTAACPPYHLAVVIGGTSAEMNLKTVKLASCRYLDGLPSEGGETGQAFRDLDMEAAVHEMTQNMGIGAQFGGKPEMRVLHAPAHRSTRAQGIVSS